MVLVAEAKISFSISIGATARGLPTNITPFRMSKSKIGWTPNLPSELGHPIPKI